MLTRIFVFKSLVQNELQTALQALLSMEKQELIDRQLVEALRCPQDQSPVTLAANNLVEQINRGIAAGRVTNLGGHRLDQPLDAGLIREAGDVLYPVINAIPVMLPDEAVELSQVRQDW